MERIKRVAGGTGKVVLALIGGILFPILIWVALGVAVNQKLRERRPQRAPAPTIGEILTAAGLTIQAETATGQAMAARTFMQQPVSEVSKLLTRAGLTIQEEAIPKHCWEILNCPPEKREACPAYARRDVPSWVAIGLGRAGRISEVCVNSTLLDVKALPSKAQA